MKKLKELFRAAEARAVALAVGGASLVGAPMAFAGGGGGITFDTSTILAGIATLLAAGIAIYTAFAAGRWTLKAFGLIK